MICPGGKEWLVSGQWLWMNVIPFVSMVVFIYFCSMVSIKFLVTGMWIMRYAVLGLFFFLVSRSSQRRRLGVLVLVLFWFCSDYLLGRFFSVFSSNDRFIIFQSVTGVSECSSMCKVEFTHVADGFLMLA